MITVDDAIEILNQVIQADREAIQQLVANRVSCNKALADHPTIQVTGDLKVGLLGIINGLFGTDSVGWGFIAAKYDDDGKLIEFVRTPLRSIEQGLNNALQELGLKGGG